MPKKSIYVADDLAARMADFEAENWSKVAAVCFEQRLAELMRQRDKDAMKAAVQRLRASKMKQVNAAQREGFEVGFQWAQHSADYGQLKRLVNHEHLDTLFGGGPSEAFSAGERLVAIVEGEDGPDRQSSNDFWTNLDAAGKQYDDDFVEGFIDGVNDFYDKVADEI
ncbi:hypothetical protein [uncultured Thiohalocapsa sp.]|uniref:hypothetical protein n=1 Tax=uncultured Thiohalocapsa sp. TaxID=768990 RepID=UPI0025E81F08|nr:hypothetical protein [uncultured Thiohalocapsa sp.]